MLDLDIGDGSMNVGSSNEVPRSCAELGASKLSAVPGAKIAPSPATYNITSTLQNPENADRLHLSRLYRVWQNS